MSEKEMTQKIFILAIGQALDKVPLSNVNIIQVFNECRVAAKSFERMWVGVEMEEFKEGLTEK